MKFIMKYWIIIAFIGTALITMGGTAAAIQQNRKDIQDLEIFRESVNQRFNDNFERGIKDEIMLKNAIDDIHEIKQDVKELLKRK